MPPSDDEETVLTGARRCKATAKSTGNRCRKPAILGATVCLTHGGGAPQVRLAARARLAALVDPAIDALTRTLAEEERVVRDTFDRPHVLGPTFAERIRAAEAILDRAGYPKRTEVDLTDSHERILERLRALRDHGAAS